LFGNQFLVSEPVRGTSGEFITLARVVKTQGRRGEVAAEIHTDIPDRFSAGMAVLALPPTESASPEARRELEVEQTWPHKGLLVLKFLGVDSISEAESLIGCELQVPRSERAVLDPGWNYVSDLAGCTVFDHGLEIGRIADVQFGTGEASLLVVKNSAGQQFDIPFAQAYLEAMDLGRRQVRMNLPQGMLEINAPLTDEEKLEQARPGKRKGH
jgi:16S rRNA processing protein RimM